MSTKMADKFTSRMKFLRIAIFFTVWYDTRVISKFAMSETVSARGKAKRAADGGRRCE